MFIMKNSYFCKTCLILLSVSLLLFSIATSSRLSETCTQIQQSDVRDPCAYYFDKHESLSPCPAVGNYTSDERRCKQHQESCCWHQKATIKCFAKPVKCYVDIRREKCIQLTGNSGIKGIYTGYSLNKSYCHVDKIPITSSRDQQLFGYDLKRGFFIPPADEQPACRVTWRYNITEMQNGRCKVTLLNKSLGMGNQQVHPEKLGKLQFNRNCVVQEQGHYYSFPINRNEKCMCRLDAWRQAKTEKLNVSTKMLHYVQKLENRSSCTQVLGNLIRNSWRDRVAPLNREEVNVVLEAFSSLTDSKDLNNFTFLDAEVLLQSARKISGYSFYEGIRKDSASEFVTKTATAVNNLIWRFSKVDNKVDKRSYVDQGPSSLTDAALREYPRNSTDNNQSRIKFEIFQTLESLTETVALHTPAINGSDFVLMQANETFVDLQVAVFKATNLTSALNQTHLQSNKRNAVDKVSVAGVPPNVAAGNASDSVAVSFVFYKFPVSSSDPQHRASDYVAVNMWNFVEGNANLISVPVEFTLKWKNPSNKSSSLTCQFLTSNLSGSEHETYSDYGCEVVSQNETTVSCACNHTTHFAVLLKVSGSSVSEHHDTVLRIMSTILGALSIAALVVTLLIFVTFRKALMKDRMLIHFHLVLALLGGYISLLSASLFVSDDENIYPGCIASAVSNHFFFLAVFFWSLVEGFYLFYKIVLVFQRKWVECLPTYSPLLGWLAPALIVIVSFTLSRTSMLPTPEDNYKDAYADQKTCFLNKQNGMIWFFMGPVAGIVTINLAILCKVLMIIYRSSSSSKRFASTNKSTRVSISLRRASRGALILMPILSIPWIVGFLYNAYSDNSPAGVIIGTTASYLQVILAGIQGILVFIFYCVYNAEVRSAYELSARRRKSEGEVSVYSTARKRSRLPLLFSKEHLEAGTMSRHNSFNQVRSHSQGTIQGRRSTPAGVQAVQAISETPTCKRSNSAEGKMQGTEL